MRQEKLLCINISVAVQAQFRSKCKFLPPANRVSEGNVFIRCLICPQGGAHGGGVMSQGGMCGRGVCGREGRVHGRGACIAGVCMAGRCAWQGGMCGGAGGVRGSA